MTGKNDDPKATMGEDARRYRWSNWTIAIGQALQLAAGLPDSGPLLTRKNPWLADSGGAHSPILDTAIKKVLRASHPFPFWEKPRAAEAELEALRKDIKRLQKRIASLNEHTRELIDLNGGPGPAIELTLSEAEEAVAEAELSTLSGMARAKAAMRLYFSPPEEYVIPVALSAMAKLDTAVVLTIEDAIEAGRSLPETGRAPNRAAHAVARAVAEYVHDVTGDLPGPRRRYSGSDFERTLAKIFKLLKIEADPQAPARSALLELRKKV